MNYFVYPLKTHIDDTDMTGVVYHANYLKFFERARSEWATELGMDIAWQKAQGVVWVVHSATIHFLKPLGVHQAVDVISTITEVRKVSFTFAQYLRLSQDPDTILCKADIKIACIDQNFKPRALPQCILHQLVLEN